MIVFVFVFCCISLSVVAENHFDTENAADNAEKYADLEYLPSREPVVVASIDGDSFALDSGKETLNASLCWNEHLTVDQAVQYYVEQELLYGKRRKMGFMRMIRKSRNL